MLYRRGEVWRYKFRFAGRLFGESAKTTSNPSLGTPNGSVTSSSKRPSTGSGSEGHR
jgi:hypothetical protein